jgi:hypothetical protein
VDIRAEVASVKVVVEEEEREGDLEEEGSAVADSEVEVPGKCMIHTREEVAVAMEEIAVAVEESKEVRLEEVKEVEEVEEVEGVKEAEMEEVGGV